MTSGISSSNTILEKYRDYAVYVNEERAIPRINDGLKSVQRIALWLMRNKSGKIKTMAFAGEMIASELYLHGDASASAAVSLMAAPFANNIPLIKGEGGFGTLLNPTETAAPRYTYVKRAAHAESIVYPDISILPMVENHDGSQQMPAFFLPLLPLVLLNGADGLGVGFSTTIMPRSLDTLKKAVISVLTNPKKSLGKIRPDYVPQGSKGSFVKYNSKNMPVWEFKGSVEIVDTSTVRVTGLPPVHMTIEKFRQFLMDMEETGEIKSFQDKSAKNIDIVVKLPRGKAKEWTEDDAIDFLKLSKQASENITVVGFNGKTIQTYLYDETHEFPDPVERLIREWVEFRFRYFSRRFQRELEDTEARLARLYLIIQVVEDKIPDIVSTLPSRGHLITEINISATKVQKRHGVSPSSSDIGYICDRPLHRWTSDSIEGVEDEIRTCIGRIKEINDILSDEGKQTEVFVEDVKAI